MAQLRITLFGKLCLRGEDGRQLAGFDARKIQELFCYLLLHRDRPYPREILASLLWGDSSTEQSKKYLRQTLWQLQGALERQSVPINATLLHVEPEWVDLNSQADLWLDIAVFEQAFAPVKNIEGRELDIENVKLLQCAIELYQGDLLEGWFQDWCIYERERLQNMYLSMLDKLMGYCEAHHEYDTGISYGTRILLFDRAREHTHRRLMRLQYLGGNRTAALRQYQRCVSALDEELSVKPAKSTIALYEQIQADNFDFQSASPAESVKADQSPIDSERETLGRLNQLQKLLIDMQQAVEQGIRAVNEVLKGRADTARSNRESAVARRSS